MSGSEIGIVLLGLIAGFFAVNYFLSRENGNRSSRAHDKAAPSGAAPDDSDVWYDRDATKEEPVEDARLFRCPRCSQRIRVRIPLSGRNVRCNACGTALLIDLDDYGNLTVAAGGPQDNQRESEAETPRTPEQCLALFGLDAGASAADIKSAYKRRMSQYHPDKVASLGEELRDVAARQTQRINQAYKLLRDRGYVDGA